MDNQYVLGIIISILLTLNGITLTYFVASVKELKKIIQDFSLAIKGSQKDIEFLNKSFDLQSKIIDKHSEEIEEIKIKQSKTN